MPILVNRTKASFTLTGPDCEPQGDAAWKLATVSERKDYYKRFGELVIYRKRRELRLGNDVQGKAFKPIKYMRPDGAKGPPLSPHYANSRFQKWLRAASTDRSVTIFWSHGWARIVGYHAFKKGPRRLPVRDAVGLSTASFRWAVDAAQLWWRNRHMQVIAKMQRDANATAPTIAGMRGKHGKRGDLAGFGGVDPKAKGNSSSRKAGVKGRHKGE